MAAPSHTTADQHDSQQLLIIVVSILLTLVTLVGISLRIYARLRLLGKLFTDDGTNISFESISQQTC